MVRHLQDTAQDPSIVIDKVDGINNQWEQLQTKLLELRNRVEVTVSAEKSFFTYHASGFTLPASRFMLHASHLTFHASRLTLHALSLHYSHFTLCTFTLHCVPIKAVLRVSNVACLLVKSYGGNVTVTLVMSRSLRSMVTVSRRFR